MLGIDIVEGSIHAGIVASILYSNSSAPEHRRSVPGYIVEAR